MSGDLSHIQGGVRWIQAQRDYAAAGQGNFRSVVFRQPMRAQSAPSGYTPSDNGVVTGIPLCKFPYLFTEPPMSKVSVWLCDTMEWREEDPQPVAEHCVVNWWRPGDQYLYGAADVSVTCRDVMNDLEVVVDIEFSGLCLITPLTRIDEWKPTNPAYEDAPPPGP